MIIFAFSSETAVAVGFGVSPSSLEFVIAEDSESSRQLIIYNTGKESGFNIESSSPEVVQVFPSGGTLPEEGQVLVIVTAFGKKAGSSENELKISIASQQTGRDVSVELGAVVGVRVRVVKASALPASAFAGMLLSTSIVLFGIAAYYASRKKIRQLLFARA